MKPLALFGIPHNALVYAFVSYMHMSVHMHVLELHSSLGPQCEDIIRGIEGIILEKHSTFTCSLTLFPQETTLSILHSDRQAHLI